MIKSLVDWEPYRPFTVGFDSLWDRLQTLELDVPNYPPYNIRKIDDCLLYTSPSPRDGLLSRMPSSA